MNESTDIDKLIPEIEADIARLHRAIEQGDHFERDAFREGLADVVPVLLTEIRRLRDERADPRCLKLMSDLHAILDETGMPPRDGYSLRERTRWARDELKKLRAEVEDESKSADLHRRLNERVAGALGLLDVRTNPETGEEYLPSWRDMPEQVAALRAEHQGYAAQVTDLRERLAAVKGLANAQIEELRLTLAAEIGRVEGAPSARWRCDGRHWYADRGDGGMDKIEMYANLNGDGTVLHKRVWLVCDMHGFEEERGRLDLARPAMLAADESFKAGSPS